MDFFADLHVHTTHSDGTLELSEVPEAAQDAGISVVAVTDHDSIHPGLDVPITKQDGVTIIRSIELRVDVPELGERVDLLGYGVERTSELVAETERLQTNRANRSQEIIDNVENELNLSLDIIGQEGMGRPHIARAIANHNETSCGYQQAFDEVIGRDCPAYVARDVTSFETGVRLLSDACSVVSLAHPFRYDDPEEAVALTEHLDGIEGPYPYDTSIHVKPTMIDIVVEKYDLVLTGGTDAHETTLGVSGLRESNFGPFWTELTR